MVILLSLLELELSVFFLLVIFSLNSFFAKFVGFRAHWIFLFVIFSLKSFFANFVGLRAQRYICYFWIAVSLFKLHGFLGLFFSVYNLFSSFFLYCFLLLATRLGLLSSHWICIHRNCGCASNSKFENHIIINCFPFNHRNKQFHRLFSYKAFSQNG